MCIELVTLSLENVIDRSCSFLAPCSKEEEEQTFKEFSGMMASDSRQERPFCQSTLLVDFFLLQPEMMKPFCESLS
jgi:hypothetical protein